MNLYTLAWKNQERRELVSAHRHTLMAIAGMMLRNRHIKYQF